MSTLVEHLPAPATPIMPSNKIGHKKHVHWDKPKIGSKMPSSRTTQSTLKSILKNPEQAVPQPERLKSSAPGPSLPKGSDSMIVEPPRSQPSRKSEPTKTQKVNREPPPSRSSHPRASESTTPTQMPVMYVDQIAAWVDRTENDTRAHMASPLRLNRL